ncbi:MAG: YfhO family protein, partial [Polyangiaceae bacterium]
MKFLGLRFVLWLFVAAAVTPRLVNAPFNVTDDYDEHYFYAHDDAARITMARYHELPAWNPYYCGGIPLAANPQDESLAPDFLLRLVYGTGPGRRLAVLLFLVLGMEGTFWVARKHECSVIGAITAAAIFSVSGRFFFMLESGWVNMFGFELLPWAVLGLERGLVSWRWRIVGGFAVAWMILAGGTYTAPYTVLVLLTLTLYDMLARLLRPALDPGDGVPWWRPFVSLASVGVATLLFAAAKILPMLHVIAQHPRTTHKPGSADAFDLIATLITSHSQDQHGMSAESYIGLLVAALAVLALMLRDRIAVRFMAMVTIFFALSMGDQGRWSLWSFAHDLPVYGQLRNPERFTIVVAFFLSLAAARALTHVQDWPRNIVHSLIARVQSFRKKSAPESLPRIAAIVCAALGVLLSAFVGYLAVHTLVMDDRMHETLFTQDAPLAMNDDFHQARGNRWDAQVWAPASRGSLQCFEETEFDQSPLLRGDLAAEELPLDPSKATVTRVSWSPSKIVLAVHATESTVVIVNQNYSRHWSASIGEVQSHEGELSVQVPAGDHELVLKYDDALFDLGVFVSLLALFAATGLFVRWAFYKVRA